MNPKLRWISNIKDKDGRSLTDHKDIIKFCTEYCIELHTHYVGGDLAILTNSHPVIDDLTILWEEVEVALKSLRNGNSSGVDNINAEMVKAGGEHIIDTLTTICNKIWSTKHWLKLYTHSLVITIHKRGIFYCVRATELSVSYHMWVKLSSMCRSTNYSQKLKPFLQKNRQISEQAKALLNKSLTSASFLKSTFNTSKNCNMSSSTSKSVWYGLAWCSMVYHDALSYREQFSEFHWTAV